MWLLALRVAELPADLDETGRPTPQDQLDVLVWATRSGLHVVRLDDLPSPIAYAVGEEEEP